jgi:MFS family permease
VQERFLNCLRAGALGPKALNKLTSLAPMPATEKASHVIAPNPHDRNQPALAESEIAKPTFRLLFACLTIVGIGNSMLFAVLPPIARETGMPDWCVSAIFTVSAVLWVATSPVWGRASDRYGRKPLIVLGLSAYAISTIAFTIIAASGLDGHLGWLIFFLSLAAARSIFGAFGSATNPAAQAYVADSTPIAIRTKEIAAVTSAFAFGSAGGPALAAALIANLGLLAPLYTVATLAALGAVGAYFFLPKIPVSIKAKPSAAASSVWRLAVDARVRTWLVVGVILSACTAVMFQQLSFYFMDRLNVPPREGASLVAVSLALGAMAQIVAQLGLLPRLSLSPRGLIVAGTLITAMGTALTVLGNNFGLLASAQMLVGLGFGLARPGFTGGASLAVGQDEQGSVAGLVVAANGAGFVVAPIFGAGVYAAFGPQAPFALCTAVLAILTIYCALSKTIVGKPLEESPADQPSP